MRKTMALKSDKALLNEIVDSLVKKYKGEIAEARANILIYLNNPAGIGEHPDVLAAIDTQVQAMANGQEKLDALQKLQPRKYPTE